jgi:hypothetical protein
MSFEYSEDNLIENATRDVLEELGWEVRYAWTKDGLVLPVYWAVKTNQRSF